jgi:hypothetical protein
MEHPAVTVINDTDTIHPPEPLLELPGEFPPDTVSFAMRATPALVLSYHLAFCFNYGAGHPRHRGATCTWLSRFRRATVPALIMSVVAGVDATL